MDNGIISTTGPSVASQYRFVMKHWHWDMQRRRNLANQI